MTSEPHTSDMAVLSHSCTLFLQDDGQPMRFYVRPGPVKRQMSPLILHGGGVMCRVEEPGALLLAQPGEARGERYISVQYVRDCVRVGERLDTEEYRLGGEKAKRKESKGEKRGEREEIEEKDGGMEKSGEEWSPGAERKTVAHSREDIGEGEENGEIKEVNQSVEGKNGERLGGEKVNEEEEGEKSLGDVREEEEGEKSLGDVREEEEGEKSLGGVREGEKSLGGVREGEKSLDGEEEEKSLVDKGVEEEGEITQEKSIGDKGAEEEGEKSLSDVREEEKGEKSLSDVREEEKGEKSLCDGGEEEKGEKSLSDVREEEKGEKSLCDGGEEEEGEKLLSEEREKAVGNNAKEQVKSVGEEEAVDLSGTDKDSGEGEMLGGAALKVYKQCGKEEWGELEDSVKRNEVEAKQNKMKGRKKRLGWKDHQMEDPSAKEQRMEESDFEEQRVIKEEENLKRCGSIRKRIPFTHDEDLAILVYVRDNVSTQGTVSGVRFWKGLEQTKIVKRTWQAMRDRYLKHLINNQEHYVLPPSRTLKQDKIFRTKQKKLQSLNGSFVAENGVVTENMEERAVGVICSTGQMKEGDMNKDNPNTKRNGIPEDPEELHIFEIANMEFEVDDTPDIHLPIQHLGLKDFVMGEDTPTSGSQTQAEETLSNPELSEGDGLQESLLDMMSEFNLSLRQVTHALLKNNGEVESTRHFLRTGSRPDGYPIWVRIDDLDLQKDDPQTREGLLKKYGADNVAKRVAFLAS
ncbi:telomeric repeat-binding factor 2-interacting protein 1 [Discoglossus pictus]